MSRPGRLLLLMALCVAIAVPSAAQIYTWPDPNGHLLLSDRRPQSEAAVRSHAVPQAEAFRTTRYVAEQVTPAGTARIYRTVERVNGRESVKFTDRKPNATTPTVPRS